MRPVVLCHRAKREVNPRWRLDIDQMDGALPRGYRSWSLFAARSTGLTLSTCALAWVLAITREAKCITESGSDPTEPRCEYSRYRVQELRSHAGVRRAEYLVLLVRRDVGCLLPGLRFIPKKFAGRVAEIRPFNLARHKGLPRFLQASTFRPSAQGPRPQLDPQDWTDVWRAYQIDRACFYQSRDRE